MGANSYLPSNELSKFGVDDGGKKCRLCVTSFTKEECVFLCVNWGCRVHGISYKMCVCACMYLQETGQGGTEFWEMSPDPSSKYTHTHTHTHTHTLTILPLETERPIGLKQVRY